MKAGVWGFMRGLVLLQIGLVFLQIGQGGVNDLQRNMDRHLPSGPDGTPPPRGRSKSVVGGCRGFLTPADRLASAIRPSARAATGKWEAVRVAGGTACQAGKASIM